MLNKEETKNIKEIKDMLDYASMCVHSNLQLDNKSSKLLYSYIEQLETRSQKVIEKLEKDINKLEDNMRISKQNGYGIDREQFTEYRYAQEILEITKGEKNGTEK